MLAVSKAAIKPKIVLLAQKDPHDAVDLPKEEGPFQSWLAVAQDIWGIGNLTPADDVFASAAVRSLAAPSNAIFASVGFHFGNRLFEYVRESGIWIDVYDGEDALTLIEKRAKDRVKLHKWTAADLPLRKNRYSQLTVLNVGRVTNASPSLVPIWAAALKKGGAMFFGDILAKTSAPAGISYGVHTAESYRAAFGAAGLKIYNSLDLSSELKLSVFRGLAASIPMLKTVRVLKEPWRKQRFEAFYRELEQAIRLHRALEMGTAIAVGWHLTKP